MTAFPMTTLAFRQNRLRQFFALTKPRVVSLIVFTAASGCSGDPGLPPLSAVIFGTLGTRSLGRAPPSTAWSSKRSTR
jgi:heme O synthase-like polyprenyltransferase